MSELHHPPNPGLPTVPSFETNLPSHDDLAVHLRRRVARMVLLAFIVTFVMARIIVLMIMTHRIPSLYLHSGNTHVHHLNYGIFTLSFVGAATLFLDLRGRALTGVALLYGFGLALTFDEFGMWLHLGGPYWQRASFDAMMLIAALLSLYCAAPALSRFRPKHWTTLILLALLLSAFGWLFNLSLKHAEDTLSPFFQQIESTGPE